MPPEDTLTVWMQALAAVSQELTAASCDHAWLYEARLLGYVCAHCSTFTSLGFVMTAEQKRLWVSWDYTSRLFRRDF